jgi:NAD(P)-dependent dehydrogenase (short-subunit alcohol dehydrogenase family)
MSNLPVCVVVGVGPGCGAAYARKFAAEGYAVALLARDAGYSSDLAKTLPHARAIVCDVSVAASIESAFADIRAHLGPPEVVIYNAGTGVFKTFDDVSPLEVESAWRVNALGPFLVAKQVIDGMKTLGRGAFVFTGATASRRGVPFTIAFAPAKAAQRSFAEALAKTLGPQGIHVAIIILDGVVDLPRTRARMPDKPDDFFIQPDDVAATAAWLVKQPRSAWSFEVEARPAGEKW